MSRQQVGRDGRAGGVNPPCLGTSRHPHHLLRGFTPPAQRIVALILACFVLSAAVARSEQLQAGAAKIDITPPLGFPMWGYGDRHDKPSIGVIDPLQARALVLGVGKDRIAIVGLDLGRAPVRKSTAAIRERVKTEIGIEHIFLVGSHTHHGPVIELDGWPDRDHSYVRQLERKLGDVIVEAAKQMRPAKIGIASKDVPFNRNRHSKRPDKPVDPEFLVLRVDEISGKTIAHAVNFAAHATSIESKDRRFSADYPGALAEIVEKETGAPCLFLQGAAGDLSTNRTGLGDYRGFGQRLGREALDLSKTIQCSGSDSCTLHMAEEDFRFRSRVDLSNPFVKGLYVNAFFKDIVDFYEREYKEGNRPHLSVALLNDQIGFVGVSGEFFCGHSLSLKRRARLAHLLFLGYCNDYQQYFPTIEGASEGGYGADSKVANAEVGAGEMMMNHALLHLYRMRGKLEELKPAK
jgi:neutral ceramidase